MNKPDKPTTSDKPHPSRMSVLLNVGARLATIIAFVVIDGLGAPKLPPAAGD